MKNMIKRGKAVSVKLKLPKDLSFKIFRMLKKDLGFDGLAEASSPFVTDLSYTDVETNRDIDYWLRRRQPAKMQESMRRFSPRCMTESESSDAYLFYARYQLSSFLRKYPFKGIDTKQRALDGFLANEKVCKTYNCENYLGFLAINDRDPRYLGIIDEIRNDIVGLLGEHPPIDSVLSQAKHGPGTSVLSDLYKGGQTTEYFKWDTLPYSVTPSAVPYAKTAILTHPQWIGALDDWYRNKFSIPIGQPIDTQIFWDTILQEVDCSRIATVPKTAEIDRTIAIEPMLNVFLQLGVDGVIRVRLKKRWGYDLNTQFVNQELARLASISGEDATVDLVAASDLTTLKICEILLPPSWYNLLLDFRCSKAKIGKEEIVLQKISSMGNGYTFALESLIFGALTRAAIRRTKSERRSAVYGDDIILPVTAYDYLSELLKFAGYRVNVDKTFCTGPFRESCGADYFHGTNVRPVFLTKVIRNLPDLFYIHNALWQLEERLNWAWGVSFEQTRELIRRYIPRDIQRQFFGPPSDSLDTYLFSDRRLKFDKNGAALAWMVQARPRKFNRGTRFYFRKLMANYGRRTFKNKWDLKRRFDTGNAFDVTKRDRVRFICTRHLMWNTSDSSSNQVSSTS